MRLSFWGQLRKKFFSEKKREQDRPVQYDKTLGYGWRSTIYYLMKDAGVGCMRCLWFVEHDADIQDGLATLEVWSGFGKEAQFVLEYELARTMEDVCRTQGWLCENENDFSCKNQAHFVVRDPERKRMFSFLLPLERSGPPSPKHSQFGRTGCKAHS